MPLRNSRTPFHIFSTPIRVGISLGILWGATTLSCQEISPSTPLPYQEEQKKDPDLYRASIRHIESGGIGYDCGYTTLELLLFADPCRWSWTPFLDVRGHILDTGKWAANGGAGVRTVWQHRVYGVHAYYDYRSTGRFHVNQVGIGVETLGEFFDCRLNGYFPFGTKKSLPYDPTFGGFSGNHLLVDQKMQSAMKGANLEFGLRFLPLQTLRVYAAAGPYYFIGEKAPATWGAKGRVRGTYQERVSLEFSDSYDATFHNKFQGEIALHIPIGPKEKKSRAPTSCSNPEILQDLMVARVERQEIPVIDTVHKTTLAIDPATGLPYFFVFVDNMSHSSGTIESPYPTLAQAQANSSPGDILYVFPGDGTTTGMADGIVLQENQRFWGSGTTHLLPTSVGTLSIPAQSTSIPTITNTNDDTEGNAITLAPNNKISGFAVLSSHNDAIFGENLESLEVSSCSFAGTTTYPIEAQFPGNGTMVVENNLFANNENGIFASFEGPATLTCKNNRCIGQTSVSSVPLEITAQNTTLVAYIEGNVFQDATTGSIRWNLDSMLDTQISLKNNTFSNNDTGSLGTLGSSCVVIPTGANGSFSLDAEGNTFIDNGANSVYVHASGSFTSASMDVSSTTFSNNGGSALVFASEATTCTLLATNNTISSLQDNGIALVGSTPFTTATITIDHNTITDISNGQNGLAFAKGSETLDCTISNNTVARCEGSGILFYSTNFTNMNVQISDNTFSDCSNDQGNAASCISLDTYTTLEATIENNAMTGSATPSVGIGIFTTDNPSVCLTLSSNSSDTTPGYALVNPGSGDFSLAPCGVEDLNTGTIDVPGSVLYISSCPDGGTCP